MQFPISTGQAARLLGTTEPRLSETVRRGRVMPAPVVLAGRRLWSLDQFRQAARALRIPEDEFDRLLEPRLPLSDMEEGLGR